MKSILSVHNWIFPCPQPQAFLQPLFLRSPKVSLTCITGENGLEKQRLSNTYCQDLANNYTVHTVFNVKRDEVQYVPQLRNIDDEYPPLHQGFRSLWSQKRNFFLEPQAFKRKTRTDVDWRQNLARIKDQPLKQSFWGRKQRAYLAQALCADPKLLILDETTASFRYDQQTRIVTNATWRVMQQHGLTILFITHDPELIEQYADYELHLEDQTGVLLEKGLKIMFAYDFMRYAFIAGIFIALICSVMGTFVVARQTSFSPIRSLRSVFLELHLGSLSGSRL